MKITIINRQTVLLFALAVWSCPAFAQEFPTIECCSDVHYIESVDSNYQPSAQIFADEVYVGTSVCSKRGATVGVEIIDDITINSGLTVLHAGSIFNSGQIVAKGGCNSNDAYNYYNSHPPYRYYTTNVFTPNGDGINDYYTMPVKNVKYYLIEVYEPGYSKAIYKAEGDVNCNWPILWDGVTGVHNLQSQQAFRIRFAFSNCAKWDKTWKDLIVHVFRGRNKGPRNEPLMESTFGYLNNKEKNTINSNEKVILYPNPTSNFISLDFKQVKKDVPVKIQVSDVFGRKILKKEFSNVAHEKIDMNEWPSGIYIFTIENGNNVYTEKVIKK